MRASRAPRPVSLAGRTRSRSFQPRGCPSGPEGLPGSYCMLPVAEMAIREPPCTLIPVSVQTWSARTSNSCADDAAASNTLIASSFTYSQHTTDSGGADFQLDLERALDFADIAAFFASGEG